MQIINNPNIPKAKGHYSTAIISNNLLFISGQLAITSEGIHHQTASFEEQFQVVFQNIRAILEASSSSLDKVVRFNIYLSDMTYWAEFNRLYAATMGNHKPVRTVIPVPELHYGYKLEIDLIAEI